LLRLLNFEANAPKLSFDFGSLEVKCHFSTLQTPSPLTTAMRLQMLLLFEEEGIASVVVIVPCLQMVQCRGFWIKIVKDGVMYRSGTDVNNNDKNVG
jgi:hypothetical protein